MKRIISLCAAFALVAALAGCGDTAKVKETKTTSTPGGTTTTTTETTVNKTGRIRLRLDLNSSRRAAAIAVSIPADEIVGREQESTASPIPSVESVSGTVQTQ